MSKITISAVLAVLRLAICLIGKVLRLLYSVGDLVDDGCLNASVPRPAWMVTLGSVISTMENLLDHTNQVEDKVYQSLNAPSDGQS